jgi:hypothetical protein
MVVPLRPEPLTRLRQCGVCRRLWHSRHGPCCRVIILADRGFGDHKLLAYLADLGFAYVVRFRGNRHEPPCLNHARSIPSSY